MSSFLEPDINYLKNFHGFEKWSEIIKKIKVKTKKLSDLEEISLKFPRNFYPYLLELEDINQITSLAKYIEKDFDKLDVLFNNAGILGQIVTLEKYDFDVWKKVHQ